MPRKRLDETVQGSGLGLHIVTDIVEMYKGKIEIIPNKKSGTYIQLQLPGNQ